METDKNLLLKSVGEALSRTLHIQKVTANGLSSCAFAAADYLLVLYGPWDIDTNVQCLFIKATNFRASPSFTSPY